MNQYKSLIRFFVIIILVFIAWSVANAFWLGPEGRVNYFIRYGEAFLSEKLLKFFGYNSSFGDNESLTKSFITVEGNTVISIADSCNALVLFVIFAGFIFAYPGPRKLKIIFIPAGIASIYLLNVIRISALAMINIHYPAYLDFNHHYTFTFLIYGWIFFLWVMFINKSEVKLI